MKHCTGYLFFTGVLWFWFGFQLSLGSVTVALLLLLYAYKKRKLWYYTVIVAGFLWALVVGYLYAPVELQKTPEGAQLIEGKILSLVSNQQLSKRFVLISNRLNGQSITPIKLMIYCRQQCPDVKAGESWQLVVTIKVNRSRYNPGSFDFERWIFSQAVQGMANLQTSQRNIRLKESEGLQGYRQWLKDRLDEHFTMVPVAASLSALLLGDRTDLSEAQRNLLAQAGLSHLIAISGLHVGLAMLPGMWFGSVVWLICFSGTGIQRHSVALVVGLIAAICYACISGLAVPAQRAVLMLTVLVLTKLSSTSTAAFQRLGLAVTLVLIIDPRAILELSFWLTTLVTAVIMVALIIKPPVRFGSLIYIQLVLASLLFALQLMFFSVYSFLSLAQNLWAIPYISLILLPISMFWLVAVNLVELANNQFSGLQDVTFVLGFLTHHFWYVLQWLESLNHALLLNKQVSMATAIVLLAVVTLFVVCRDHKTLGVAGLMLVLLLTRDSYPDLLRITFLDIGQGTAILIQQQDNLVIYDSGYGINGQSTLEGILPHWLLAQQIGSISHYIESHMDIDHSGGTEWLLTNYPIGQYITSNTKVRPYWPETRHCEPGYSWHISKVTYKIVWPLTDSTLSDNDASCVLLVEIEGYQLLLTGDIETRAEQQILQMYPQLKVDSMSVPHHGSLTSSSSQFISRLGPDIVINSSGFGNRFGFPHPDVVRRYTSRGIAFYDTAEHGQIILTVNQQGNANIELTRQQTPALWRRN